MYDEKQKRSAPEQLEKMLQELAAGPHNPPTAVLKRRLLPNNGKPIVSHIARELPMLTRHERRIMLKAQQRFLKKEQRRMARLEK